MCEIVVPGLQKTAAGLTDHFSPSKQKQATNGVNKIVTGNIEGNKPEIHFRLSPLAVGLMTKG